jgi:hypothetical protein
VIEKPALIGACIALALLVPPTEAAAVIDQSSIPSGLFGGSGPEIDSDKMWAQTVTAGVTGVLQAIELRISDSHEPPNALVVQLQSVSGGTPNGMALASVSLSRGAVPPSLAIPTFIDLSPLGLEFANGEIFAIVLRSDLAPGAAGQPQYNWWGAGGDIYSRGEGLQYVNGSWRPAALNDDLDFYFATYVAPLAVSEPTSLALFGFGLAGMGVMRRKKLAAYDRVVSEG